MKICLLVRDMVMLVSPNIVFRGARGAGTDWVGVAFEMYVDPGGRRDGSLQVWGVNWILFASSKELCFSFRRVSTPRVRLQLPLATKRLHLILHPSICGV